MCSQLVCLFLSQNVCEPGQTLWLTHGSHHFGGRCLLCTRLWMMWFHWGTMNREYYLIWHSASLVACFTESLLCFFDFFVDPVGLFLVLFHDRLPPTYTFHFLDSVNEKIEDRPRIPMEQTVPSQSHPFPSRLVSNKRVTDTSHFQDVRHIEFDITGSHIEWVMLNFFKRFIPYFILTAV